MKTSNHRHENQIVHAAFLDALSGEFIARTGCGAYVYLNPVDIYRMFNEFQNRGTPVRDYVKQEVKTFLAA